MKAPKLLFILGGFTVLLIFGVMWSHHRRHNTPIQPQTTMPITSTATVGAGDTNNEVLRTVLAKQDQLARANARLQAENAKLERQRQDQFETALKDAKTQMQNQLDHVQAMLGGQIEQNKQDIDHPSLKKKPQQATYAITTAKTDSEQINPTTGMILQAPDAAGKASATPAMATDQTTSTTTTTAISETNTSQPPLLPSDPSTSQEQEKETTHHESTITQPTDHTATESQADSHLPYYTLPANSTLNDVSLMTAIIGEVPVSGKLIEPAFGFKAIIGRKDLYAANGASLPQDIAGMVVAGYSVGNMTMSCARAYVTQVLFVFSDGHFEVYPKKPTDDGTAIYPQNALGYLSDPYGNTCIAGKYLTDAPKVLASFAALGAVSAGGSAYANSQTTQQVSGIGTVTSLTGDLSKYMVGQGLAGGSQQALNWYSARVSGIFDAVYIPASYRLKNGQQRITGVVLNLSQTIPIDYTPHGRRLDQRLGPSVVMRQTLD